MFFGLNFGVFAQINMGDETAKRLIDKELIFIKTGDSLVDSFLKEAVEIKWRFNPSVYFTDWKMSEEMVKESPNTYVRMKLQLITGVMVTTSTFAGMTSTVSEKNYGDMYKLLYFEDSPNRVFETSLASNFEISEGVLIEGVQRACNVIENIVLFGSWNKFFLKSNGAAQLKELTLLIPNELVGSEEDKEEMKKMYAYKMEFLPLSEIYEKIKGSEENYAYLVSSEESVGVHIFYICKTNNSQKLCHAYKTFQTMDSITKAGVDTLDTKFFKKLISDVK
jgi:hypothetical protein